MESERVKSLGRVYFYLDGEIAVFRIDNPPVNARSHSVRQGLVDALDEATAKKASGARITGTAARMLAKGLGKTALATMCIGVGQGIAISLEAT